MKCLKIVAIGDELLNGAISDTNSAEISRVLDPLGFRLESIVIAPDRLDRIVKALAQSAEGADLLITTGGLGPTSDDLTREAISEFVSAKLEECPSAKTKLEEFFKKRGRQLSTNNYRQVQFPAGAKVLSNEAGTADAFVSFHPTTNLPIISLPGVPRELTWLLTNQVGPWIETKFGAPTSKISRSYLRVFGLSESYLGTQIESLKLLPALNVAYRPMSPEILLTISTDTAEVMELEKATERIKLAVGPEFVISHSPSLDLTAVVAGLLGAEKKTIAIAESCTGGKIADLLTALPGISQTFLASAVTYSNESKSALLGVDSSTLATHGAVSAETAGELAQGIKDRTSSDFGVSVTGIAGPDGGTPEKPVGTFFVGMATDLGVTTHKFYMPNERNLFRRHAAFTALDLVRRQLLGLQLDWKRQ